MHVGPIVLRSRPRPIYSQIWSDKAFYVTNIVVVVQCFLRLLIVEFFVKFQ